MIVAAGPVEVGQLLEVRPLPGFGFDERLVGRHPGRGVGGVVGGDPSGEFGTNPFDLGTEDVEPLRVGSIGRRPGRDQQERPDGIVDSARLGFWDFGRFVARVGGGLSTPLGPSTDSTG